jgi:hypothetical protein
VASFIGRPRFFLEANRRMPRTFGHNQVHVSQVVGWVEAEQPLVDVPPAPVTAVDHRIAGFVAERIPDEATIQVGIGSSPTPSSPPWATTETSASTPNSSPTASWTWSSGAW